MHCVAFVAQKDFNLIIDIPQYIVIVQNSLSGARYKIKYRLFLFSSYCCQMFSKNTYKFLKFLKFSKKIWLFYMKKFLSNLLSYYLSRFSMGGMMLASASLDKSVKLWTSQMNCKATLTEHTRYVNCICFNSDGMIMCSGE